MEFKTSGVCAKNIDITVEDGVIKELKFIGGCNGNGQGIGALVVGMKIEDVKERLKGIKCGPRATSCPDQLSKILEENF